MYNIIVAKTDEEIRAIRKKQECYKLLRNAVIIGCLEDAIIAIDGGADPTIDDYIAFKDAIWYNHTDIIEVIITKCNVDPSLFNNYAIRQASLNNNTDLIRFLLRDKRVNPSDCNNFAIINAFKRNNREMIYLLLPKIDITINTENILNTAIGKHRDIVRKILQDERLTRYSVML